MERMKKIVTGVWAFVRRGVVSRVLAAVMIGALTIFLLTVKEPQWVAQMQSDSIRYGIEEKQEENAAKRELSASDVLEAYIASAEATDGEVNAYITKTYDLAAAQARRADERIAAGELPALAGVPFAVKDNL